MDALLAAVTDELRQQGAEVERTDDGVRAQLPLVRWMPRRLTEWRKRVPFQDVRDIEVHVAQTDRAFHLVVSGRTTALVPITATIVGVVAAGLLHAGPFVAPFVGFGVGLATWANTWLWFSVGVREAVSRCAAALAADGA